MVHVYRAYVVGGKHCHALSGMCTAVGATRQYAYRCADQALKVVNGRREGGPGTIRVTKR